MVRKLNVALSEIIKLYWTNLLKYIIWLENINIILYTLQKLDHSLCWWHSSVLILYVVWLFPPFLPFRFFVALVWADWPSRVFSRKFPNPHASYLDPCCLISSHHCCLQPSRTDPAFRRSVIALCTVQIVKWWNMGSVCTSVYWSVWVHARKKGAQRRKERDVLLLSGLFLQKAAKNRSNIFALRKMLP